MFGAHKGNRLLIPIASQQLDSGGPFCQTDEFKGARFWAVVSAHLQSTVATGPGAALEHPLDHMAMIFFLVLEQRQA